MNKDQITNNINIGKNKGDININNKIAENINTQEKNENQKNWLEKFFVFLKNFKLIIWFIIFLIFCIGLLIKN